jgi:hypothetical protein
MTEFANNKMDLTVAAATPFWSINDMIEPVPLPPLPTITPTSKVAVITLGIGVRGLQMLDISRKSIRRYASKCNADYHEITANTATIPIYPLWDKFRVEQYFDHYERIIYIDADVIVRDSAPNLFEIVPEDHVGKHDDLPYMTGGFAWYYTEIEELVKSQGYPMPVVPPYMLNSGVWVASREHRDAFKPMTKPFIGRHCSEQNNISIRLCMNGYKVWDMPSDLHWEWFRDKSMKEWHTGQFIHFAGVTDHKKRIALMRIAAASAGKPTITVQSAKQAIEKKKPCGCGKTRTAMRK